MKRSLAALGGLALTLGATAGPLAPPAASAAPSTTAPAAAATALAGADDGRGAVGSSQAGFAATARAAASEQRAATVDEPLTLPASYPYQPTLKIFGNNVPDATDTNKTISHDDIAPVLTDLMRASNRISTQVVGQSTQGRDLYLVTVTAPETAAQTAAQEAWKQELRNDPRRAQADPALQAGYKAPVWFSANIHGNEWEGTDAAMQVIDDLVTSPWAEVKDLLRENRLYFSLSLNPDGRTLGQRATALSLDANRDMITGSTPESRSFVRTAQAVQPLYSADLHGYTGVLQVEPCGPPHGENYEYDLFIPHGYAIARKVEDEVVAADIPGNTYYDATTGRETTAKTGKIKIPYRDTPSGWDDFPPIFTAQYAAYFGAVTSTVELPKGRTGATTTPADAVINTAVAKQTILSMIDYVDDNAPAMIRNQAEIFRRGVDGEPKTSLTLADVAAVPGPAEWKPLWDVVDDQDPVVLPRAYVIPVGARQRSASDARNVVEHLLTNGVQVATLDAPTTVGGTTYPAGSYVVDMHQPLRGMANTLLDLGSDISLKVPSMYDISAWSYSYLWGATVDKVGLTADAPIGATTPVIAPSPAPALPAAGSYLALDVAGVGDVQAVNALLDQDVEVSLLESGTAVVGPEDRAAVAAVAADLDVTVVAATPAEVAALAAPGTRGLADLKVGYTGNALSDDMLALTELGFDVERVTAADVTTVPGVLDDVDVLWAGSALAFSGTTAAGLPVFRSWVDAGHGVVGRGAGGLSTATAAGLVSATATAGNGSGNGIVAVDTPAGSLIAPFAQSSAFVSGATSFTALGATTVAAQTYAADPLLAGHWRATTATNGPEVAAGRASAIAGTSATGSRGFVFGTSPLYRTHPKGGMSQVARALLWAGPQGAEVAAPTGPVTTPPVVTPPVTTPPAPPAAGPRPSSTVMKAKRVTRTKVRITVTVSVDALPASGTVRITDRGRLLRTLVVGGGTASRTVTVTVRGAGKHALLASYTGSAEAQPSTSVKKKFTIRG